MGFNDIQKTIKSLIRLLLSFIVLSELFSVISADFIIINVNASATQISFNTETFTYELPNYNVTYMIKKMPPPDSQSVNPCAYNLIVRGPPPYPIQVEFYQQDRIGMTEKVTYVVSTDALSNTRGCTGYPSQITMKFLDNESVSSSPTSTPVNGSEYNFGPTVPEFTLKFVDNSYDVPKTYSIDPYSGKNLAHGGYRVQVHLVEVWIKNQLFTSYLDENGTALELYYKIRFKGHFEDWTSESLSTDYISSSSSEYTVKSFTLGYYGEEGFDLSYAGQIDFQVEALIGKITQEYVPHERLWTAFSYVDIFHGERSGWSTTQTFTYSENPLPTLEESKNVDFTSEELSSDASATSTEEPITFDNQELSQTEQLTFILAVIATVTSFIALIIGLLIYKKIPKTKSFTGIFLLMFLVNGCFLSFSSNLWAVQASDVSNVPIPSVPEFTVTFTDNSYDVPPVYGTDPYTNETIVLEEAHHVQNKTIELVITNQPFSCPNDFDENPICLYHSIRFKGHYADSWSYPNYSSYIQLDENETQVNYLGAVGEYTKTTFGIVGNNDTKITSKQLAVSEGGQIDFQVQAFIGYRTRVNGTFVPGVPVSDPTDPIPHHYVFSGQTSEWSEIQTLTVPKTDAEVMPENPTNEDPSHQEISPLNLGIIVPVLLVFVLVVAVLLYLLMRRR